MIREHNDSILSGNVEYSYEINNSLMIEGYAKINKSTGKLRDYSVFPLNDVESTFNDKPIEKYMEKRKYEQAVSECKKWRSLIKKAVGRKFTVISKNRSIYCLV